MPKTTDKKFPSENQIRERAYEIYASRGYADGYEIEDWLTAERELQEFMERQAVTKSDGRATAASPVKPTSNIPSTRADSATAGQKRA